MYLMYIIGSYIIIYFKYYIDIADTCPRIEDYIENASLLLGC